MTPEELIQQLGPGTDGAVCVQRLLDQIAGVKDHVKKAVAEDARTPPHASQLPASGPPHPPPHVEPRVAMADTTDDEEKADKEEKHPHTPYRNPKR